jgi:cyclopropane-fatty-acyl-phospholipid synthase
MKRGIDVSAKIASLFREDLPLAIKAFDGSRAGNSLAAESFEIKSPLALRYILSSPGDLGLARAYIAEELEIRGDLHKALITLRDYLKRPFPRAALLSLSRSVGVKAFIRPDLPDEEAPARWKRGLLHSLNRDSTAIAHHYDVSNEFYALILGPTMVYSCALFRKNGEETALDDAQIAKLDLICRKLDLRSEMKLLDVGCGWGTLVLHAAKEYGVKAVGVTLSRVQLELAQSRVAASGLSDRVEIRLQDYRQVQETDFDAISSVGMSEHVGDSKLEGYFQTLRKRIVDDGRLLNHCITRPTGGERARTGAFIDRYIFPDSELSGSNRVIQSFIDSGFELRHSENLREHYALTLSHWRENLLEHWDDSIAQVGVRRVRLWNLYMALCQIGFEANNLQIHQFLGEAVGRSGASAFPLSPNW